MPELFEPQGVTCVATERMPRCQNEGHDQQTLRYYVGVPEFCAMMMLFSKRSDRLYSK